MSLTIKTNLSSLIAQNSLKTSTNKLNQAIERMSTGYKINHAKDNAANYSIATNYSTKLSALQVAEDNVNMGLDMLSTAEESLNQITNALSKVRELAVQANNGTYGGTSLSAISAEAEALLSNIEQVYKRTEYNGIKLFYEELNVDESKRVVKQTEFVSGKTYYIANSKDLVALQDLVNSGVDTTNVNFELVKNIDMSGVDFRGIGVDETNFFKGNFDGKGHIISNLTISTSESYVGLFGYAKSATIVDVGLENCDISGYDCVGGIVGYLRYCTLTGCYAKGTVNGHSYVGGAFGGSNDCANLKNLYFKGTVTGSGSYSGGIAGALGVFALGGSVVNNCYSEGNVNGHSYVGGAVGGIYDGATVKNCYSTCSVSGKTGTIGGVIGAQGAYISNIYYSGNVSVSGSGTISNKGVQLTLDEIIERYDDIGFTEENGWKLVDGELLLSWQKNSNFSTLDGQNEVDIQCGTKSQNASSIGFDISFELGDIGEILAGLGKGEVLKLIDDKLSMLENKATEYGSIQNRLFSVLDEISIQYDNLVSSRSTIKDADIADVSAEYIKMQILQQASATLMATANQSPAIALQLL